MKLLILASLAVAASFAQKINIEFDPAVDFAKFRTYSIREGRLNSKSPALNSELVRKRIDAAIQKTLAGRRLAFVPEGPADLNLHYTLGAAARVQQERYPAGWRGWGRRVVRVPYTEGTLVIDLRDAATRSLVWRGIARADKRNAADIERKLDDMVKKLLEKFPPKR